MHSSKNRMNKNLSTVSTNVYSEVNMQNQLVKDNLKLKKDLITFYNLLTVCSDTGIQTMS